MRAVSCVCGAGVLCVRCVLWCSVVVEGSPGKRKKKRVGDAQQQTQAIFCDIYLLAVSAVRVLLLLMVQGQVDNVVESKEKGERAVLDYWLIKRGTLTELGRCQMFRFLPPWTAGLDKRERGQVSGKMPEQVQTVAGDPR